MKDARTFQQRYYLTNRNPFRAMRRNIDLGIYTLGVIRTWLVDGGRLRRAHRRAMKSGIPFEIDYLAETSEVRRRRR